MQTLSEAEFHILIDMLSDHTAKYSKLLVDGDRGEEFEASKKLIKLLQAEITSRMETKKTITTPTSLDAGNKSLNIQKVSGSVI